MNKYLRQLRKQGSANELDALIANRNALIAQGNAAEALALDVRINQLKAKGMKPTQAACFSPDSKVLTPSGYKKISSLKKGDSVVSLDQENNRTFEQIKKVQIFSAAVLYDFHLENGTVISATRHHTILTENGWKKLKDIRINDKLIISETYKTTTSNVKKINNPRVGKVYNLHTTGSHNFIVDGMIAHNFTVARRFRSLIHDVFEYLPNRSFAVNL